ncbi:MAG: DUF3842 family protein [Firmicutes bacterium]|nr:DUF3842 family protein [Bacillota bacterium]
MKIAVVDGQGGGLGKAIIEKLSKEVKGEAYIIALGTNAMATASMFRAGADEGATGANAIIFTADKVDIIVGSVAILAANAMLGEFSPRMAEAIGSSSAKKILIPLNRCHIEVVGTKDGSLPQLIDLAVSRVKEICKKL